MADTHRTPALDALGRRVAAGLVAAVLIAVAGGVALVAAAFALYAALEIWVSPAAASALTALAFAVLAAGLAMAAPAAIRGAPTAKPVAQAPSRALPIDNAVLRLGAEIAVTVFGLLAELALKRRVEKTDRRRR